MKKTMTSQLGLLMAAVAIFVASCSSNATFSKRYHNRGFNIAWGGGNNATPTKPVTKKTHVATQKPSQTIANQTETQASATSIIANVPAVNPNLVVVTSSVNVSNPVNTRQPKLETMASLSTEKVVAATKSTKQHVLKASNRMEKKKSAADPGEGKSQIIALVLCIVVGVFGIHRFYLGYTLEGVLMLLTGGGCGVWLLIDVIRIITGDLQPKDGDYTETL